MKLQDWGFELWSWWGLLAGNAVMGVVGFALQRLCFWISVHLSTRAVFFAGYYIAMCYIYTTYNYYYYISGLIPPIAHVPLHLSLSKFCLDLPVHFVTDCPCCQDHERFVFLFFFFFPHSIVFFNNLFLYMWTNHRCYRFGYLILYFLS